MDRTLDRRKATDNDDRDSRAPEMATPSSRSGGGACRGGGSRGSRRGSLGRRGLGSGGRGSGSGGGPYAAQHIGGMAALDGSYGGVSGAGLFGEIVGRGVQVGMGTIAGLGYGLPMSRLYAR